MNAFSSFQLVPIVRNKTTFKLVKPRHWTRFKTKRERERAILDKLERPLALLV
jgi:hypothetical protein